MLQRVQTIFLALIIVLELVFLFAPIHSEHAADATKHMTMDAWKVLVNGQAQNTGNVTTISESPNVYIGGIAIAVIVATVFSIFQYNNRLNQMKLGILNAMLILVQAIAVFIVSKQADDLVNQEGYGTQQFGFYIPFFALLLNMAANRFIRKDEQLVRSMDRLR